MKKDILAFLKQNYLSKKPLLIGFSGGEDSLALVHCMNSLKVPMHLAHFDHAWRETSQKEARELALWAEKEGVLFFTKRSLNRSKDELGARVERYEFFQELYEKGNYEALVLAHHQNDQGETVLKRIFEGAYLTNLKGMSPCSTHGQMSVWRPLLQTAKEEILTYIKTCQLNPIEDPTNLDPAYLRGRLRESLLPELSKTFGKEILPALMNISEYSAKLEDYLKNQVEKYKETEKEGPFGILVDFTSFFPLNPQEMHFALKEFFKRQGLCPSKPVLEEIFSLLSRGAANKKIHFANREIIIDRGILFLLTQISKKGEWKVTFSELKSRKQPHWRQVWEGKVEISLPKGSYELITSDTGVFKKLWTNHKVPAHLHGIAPLIAKDGEVVAELLSGKTQKNNSDSEDINIILEIKNPSC